MVTRKLESNATTIALMAACALTSHIQVGQPMTAGWFFTGLAILVIAIRAK